MTRDEQLKFCNICTNRAFSNEEGTICRLTNKIADFEGNCSSYVVDEHEAEIENQKELIHQKTEKKTINKGRYVLLAIGLINLALGLYQIWNIYPIFIGIVDSFIGLLFIGFGIWSFRQPYYAMISGLSTYLLINLLLIFVNPFSLFNGIILKIIIVTYLAFGIRSAREAQSQLQKKKEDLIDQF
ncbi:MAG: hypothetical protein RL264_2850 [Bacteroidota bacterium]|jgi:hypothetical protein